jgi:hypothetical protein
VLVFSLSAQDRSALKNEIFCQTAQYLSRDAQKKHDYKGCYSAVIEKNIKELPEKSRELLLRTQSKLNDNNTDARNFAEEIFRQLEKSRNKRLSEESYLSFKSDVNKLLTEYAHERREIALPPVDSIALMRMQILELKLENDRLEREYKTNLKSGLEQLRSDVEFYVWILLVLLVLCFVMIFIKGRQQSKKIAVLEETLRKFINEKGEEKADENS